MILDYFNFALRGIKNRKLRSWLTMIGIFIGITAVVALISIGQGMQAAIDDQFKKVGSNRIIISPGGGGVETSNFMMAGLVSAKLTDDDVEFIRKIKGVDFAAGPIIQPAKVKYKDQVKYLTSANVPTDEQSIKFLEGIEYFIIQDGNYLEEDDADKIAIGYETAHSVFDEKIEIGDKIFIENQEFEVIGIYKKTGNPIHDNKVAMSLDDARDIFNMGDEVSSVFATVKDGFDVGEVADRIEKELRNHRGLKEGDEDFTVATAEQTVGVFKDLLLVIQFVLIGIAAISLIVGGIGIMTTMYTSVIERTHEIGIMKAVGAKNSDIGVIFLIESGLLGAAGGVIGIVLGIGMSFVVEFAAKQAGLDMLKTYISLELVIGALLFSFIVGAISGLLPAMRASKMKPVDALRRR